MARKRLRFFDKMKIFDCTTFFEEHLMMELRFNILKEYVDKFIIVESKFSHSGKRKNLSFDLNNYKKFKDKYDDGSFDTKDVNTHQLHSYHLTMKNKAETLTQGSSQPEVFNVLGQLQSIERVKKENEQLEYKKQDKLSHKPEKFENELGAKSE